MQTSSNSQRPAAGHRHHVVGPAAGHGSIDVGDASVLVTLHGSHNVVTGGTGDVSVVGGLNHNTITLGSGNDAVQLGAQARHDNVVLGSGNDTVTAGPGAWGNAFTLMGSTAALTLHGHDNTVLVDGGADSIVNSVIGLATNTHSTSHGSLLLAIGSAGGNVDVTGFPVVCGTICLASDLGFATAGDACSAVTSDGHGGSMLVFGGGLGSIDFQNVAPGALHASNFQIA